MKTEEYYLRISLYGAAFMAFFGLLMGVLARSQMLVFDGLYSFAGVLMSMVMIMVSRFLKKEDPKRFHYGKASVEPLVLMLNYLLLLMIIAMSVWQAVLILWSGGRMLALELALLYTVITIVVCFSMHGYLKTRNKVLRSPLIKADIYQWRLDGWLTVAVLGAFIMAYGFTFFEATQALALFVDPVMVIAVSLYFIYLAYAEFKIQVLQLMGAAPNSKMTHKVEAYVNKLNQMYHFDDTIVRFSLHGRLLYIDIDFIVSEQASFDSIDRQDQLRRVLDKELQTICKTQLWLTVVYTKDRALSV